MGAGLSVRPLSVVEVAPRGILEASSEAPRLPVRANTWDRVRKYIGQYGLIAVLLIMPVVFGLHDLSTDGNLTRLGNNLVAGLSNGAIWALIALGYTLVYGIIELINFAHGEVFMMGAFFTMQVVFWVGVTSDSATWAIILALGLALLAAMAFSGLLNFTIDRVAYRRLRNAPRLAPLIAAIGVSFILQNIAIYWRGPNPIKPPQLIRTEYQR